MNIETYFNILLIIILHIACIFSKELFRVVVLIYLFLIILILVSAKGSLC
jgi:hypothetical protein